MPIRILIADDQRLFRQGLRSLLDQEEGLTVVGEAADGQDAFTLAQEINPDIILMDVEMPKLNGIQALRLILERKPEAKVLMLSVLDDDERVKEAIVSGAIGYIMKDADHNEFVRIIKSAYEGKKITSPFLANYAPRPAGEKRERDERAGIDRFSLTEREKGILALLLEGKSNKEISNLTFVSTETVKTHLQNIYRKLGVKSRLEAVALLLKEKNSR
jgi:DNA-binding NarL/FixJ family response regulator